MSIPLVQNNEKDSINTSIIAIKKNLERINSILGLVDSGSDIDTSEFVKKSDIVDVVQSGNMNPVTSNAVVPVDEVTLDNMQSVTSNAVAESLSYSTTEQKTGGVWIDGKPIYKKVIDCGALPNNTSKAVAHNITNIDIVFKLYGVSRIPSSNIIPLPFVDVTTPANGLQLYLTTNDIVLRTKANRSNYTKTYVTIIYTKTTD